MPLSKTDAKRQRLYYAIDNHERRNIHKNTYKVCEGGLLVDLGSERIGKRHEPVDDDEGNPKPSAKR